jgi:hypothetical protein
MHYGNEEQVKKNRVKLVIYKHSYQDNYLGKSVEEYKNYEYDVQLCSVQECRYVAPRQVVELFISFKYMFKAEIDAMPLEKEICVTLRDVSGYGKFIIENTEEVDLTDHGFLRLH